MGVSLTKSTMRGKSLILQLFHFPVAMTSTRWNYDISLNSSNEPNRQKTKRFSLALNLVQSTNLPINFKWAWVMSASTFAITRKPAINFYIGWWHKFNELQKKEKSKGKLRLFVYRINETTTGLWRSINYFHTKEILISLAIYHFTHAKNIPKMKD